MKYPIYKDFLGRRCIKGAYYFLVVRGKQTINTFILTPNNLLMYGSFSWIQIEDSLEFLEECEIPDYIINWIKRRG